MIVIRQRVSQILLQVQKILKTAKTELNLTGLHNERDGPMAYLVAADPGGGGWC